eukprot:6009304-Prymnesium_polylepis.2
MPWPWSGAPLAGAPAQFAASCAGRRASRAAHRLHIFARRCPCWTRSPSQQRRPLRRRGSRRSWTCKTT